MIVQGFVWQREGFQWVKAQHQLQKSHLKQNFFDFQNSLIGYFKCFSPLLLTTSGFQPQRKSFSHMNIEDPIYFLLTTFSPHSNKHPLIFI